MTELQKVVAENVWIENVYFNANGEWLFGEGNPNFTTVKTREEVLAESVAEADTKSDNKTKQK